MSNAGPPDKLNDRHMLAAYKEVAGKKPVQIAQEVGLSLGRLHIVRASGVYQVFIEGIRREVREKVTDRASKLGELFNEEAEEAFNTQKELNKSADSDGVRLSASNSILDRAPDAPKIVKNTGNIDARTIIQLPVKVAESMVDTLKMVGAGEIVDLYEEAGEFQAPGAEDDVPGLVTLAELEESFARN